MSDLQLAVPFEPGLGRRAALEDALRAAIRAGRLHAGAALPSTRQFAADLDVSRSTVVAAYEQLVAEGYLITEQGSATRVAALGPLADAEAEVDLLGPVPQHDFRPGEPDPSSFPRQRWMRSMRRVVDDMADLAFGYPDPRGVPRLRSALADHLVRTRTVATTSAGVRVVGGFAAGIGFVGEMLRRRGVERIAVEDPMLRMHADLIRISGLELVSVPVEAEGIDLERLDAADVGAVLVTPAHQYPTGITMTPQRRRDLIDWARHGERWIIEDDYDGEFRYDRRPVGSLQGLGPDRVIYSGTASKSLAPALRIGWLVVPDALRRDLLRTMHIRSGVSGIDQFALADFIERGELDRHTRQMRARYAQRSTELKAVLADTAPWLAVRDVAAGLHVLGRIASPDIDEATVLSAAEHASVGLAGLRAHHVTTSDEGGLAIGFSRPPAHHFPTALEHLGNLLDTFTV